MVLLSSSVCLSPLSCESLQRDRAFIGHTRTGSHRTGQWAVLKVVEMEPFSGVFGHKFGVRKHKVSSLAPCNRITPYPPIRTEIRCPLYIKSALIPPLRRGPFSHQINAKSRYIRRRINCRLGGGAWIIIEISALLEG